MPELDTERLDAELAAMERILSDRHRTTFPDPVSDRGHGSSGSTLQVKQVLFKGV